MKKFCILAAGRGTRINAVQGLHKALLPLENRPVICHIFDKVPKDVEIVVAVGYKSEQIIKYIKTVHASRKVTFVEVDNFDKQGSGPGYSLLACKEYLQEPFVFTSADTLVEDSINFDLECNWVGVSPISGKDSSKYCLVKDVDGYLVNFYYGSGDRAFIGMAGIYDYEKFWQSLAINKSELTINKSEEHQVTCGFDSLGWIQLIDFKWYDTGSNGSYAETRKRFSNEIVANKSSEALFIDSGKVVKYFDDVKRVASRVERTKYLNKMTPEVLSINDNMYGYNFINGLVLSEIYDEGIMRQFLDECQEKLFVKQKQPKGFLRDCHTMYEQKTKERLKSLPFGLDKIKYINGVRVSPVHDMISKINWNRFYSNAIPSYYHGDLQSENILYDKEKNKFVLLDWREQFGENIEVGDVYYDLAKLYHSLLINGRCILDGMFDYSVEGNRASVQFYAKNNLVCFMNILKDFCDEKGYVWSNVRLLGLLQYLNIWGLYDSFRDGKYGRFLFLYGKYLLAKFLEEEKLGV